MIIFKINARFFYVLPFCPFCLGSHYQKQNYIILEYQYNTVEFQDIKDPLTRRVYRVLAS